MSEPIGTVPGVRIGQRVVAALVVCAVGHAFADASVVALALPDLYAEFDTSIVGVSSVLTLLPRSSVAITALPVALVHRRVRPLDLVVVGVSVFAAASVLAGVASSLAMLLMARSVHGAALLLAGSLPVLASLDGAGGVGRGGGGRWPARSVWRSVRRWVAYSHSCSTGGRSSSFRRQSPPRPSP